MSRMQRPLRDPFDGDRRPLERPTSDFEKIEVTYLDDADPAGEPEANNFEEIKVTLHDETAAQGVYDASSPYLAATADPGIVDGPVASDYLVITMTNATDTLDEPSFEPADDLSTLDVDG